MADLETFIGTDIKHESDFVNDGTGDLETITGLDNMKAAILRRLMTVPGSVAYRPDYGVGIQNFQNAPMTIEVQRSLALRVSEQLPLDNRIESVSSVEFQLSETTAGLAKLIVSVKIKGYGDAAFDFTPFGEVP
jgi:phage baseplate assembly protein W